MSNFDIQILVNGSRCKQYVHENRTYIEAKQGSEYSIEIKNNTYSRILAVCSVDGLDIISGKPAKETSPGYVIGGSCNDKFDGFRVSSDKIAKFTFDVKNNSFAASKDNGSEKNVGVIGVRVFNEKILHHPHPIVNYYHYNTPVWYNSPYNIVYGITTAGSSQPTNYNNNVIRSTQGLMNGGCSSAGNIVKCSATPASATGTNNSLNTVLNESLGFDMGTTFGKAKESKVVEVTFEKGILAFTKNIYYASRQSLIEMGVPIGSEKTVNFPEPFTDNKYATHPKGWVEE